jgi:DNA repair ATPase RecN
MLSTLAYAEEEMTTAGKVAEALSIFDEIKAKTETIENGKTTLKASANNIKSLVSELRAAGVQPTEEEKVIIEAYITEIKGIEAALTDTIGKAYKRMHDLRGSYNLANIDTIYTTFNEVNDVLDIRVEKLDRLNEIANEVTALLEEKTIEEPETEE